MDGGRLERVRGPAETGDNQHIEDEDDDERQQTVGDESQVVKRFLHERNHATVHVRRSTFTGLG